MEPAWAGLSDRENRRRDSVRQVGLPNWFAALQPEARQANLALVELLKRIARRKNATPAQIALAWLLAQKPWIVPIPGTRKLERLEENRGSADVELTAEDLREINTPFAKIPVEGARLPEAILQYSNR